MADKIYLSKEWRALRIEALKRDKYICQLCGRKIHEKGTSQVDHIIPVKQAPHLALVLNNLRSLCRYCHARFDNGRRNKYDNFKQVDINGLPEDWQ